MTQTFTQPKISIGDLGQALLESRQHEHKLAVEVDELPEKIEVADARLAEHEAERQEARAALPEAREAFYAAEERFNRARKRMVVAENGVDVCSSEKADAQRRLDALEAEYPSAS